MECVLCDEPVTNPICQDCLGEAIEQWLGETAPNRLGAFADETAALRSPHGITCIRCHGPVGVCTYCYTRSVFNWLREGDLQRSFVDVFNFDFYRTDPYNDGHGAS